MMPLPNPVNCNDFIHAKVSTKTEFFPNVCIDFTNHIVDMFTLKQFVILLNLFFYWNTVFELIFAAKILNE